MGVVGLVFPLVIVFVIRVVLVCPVLGVVGLVFPLVIVFVSRVVFLLVSPFVMLCVVPFVVLFVVLFVILFVVVLGQFVLSLCGSRPWDNFPSVVHVTILMWLFISGRLILPVSNMIDNEVASLPMSIDGE